MVQLGLNQEEYMEAKKRLNKRVNRIGFWAAILTVILTVSFFAIAIFGTPSYVVPYPYIPSIINYMDYLWLYPAFLLAFTFLVLMACIYYYTAIDKKIFSLIGLAFALGYAIVITTDFFLQWTVVLPTILNGTESFSPGSFSLVTEYNPHGVFVALESLAYLMMSVALLFIAPVFEGGKIEHAIRWIFIVGFILAIGSFVSLSLMRYDIVIFEVVIITINVTVLIVSGILLSILFQRANSALE